MSVFYGTSGDDFISGTQYADFFEGGLGNDLILGGAGSDTINGGYQEDTLYGDEGDDVFLHAGNDGWDSYYGGSGTDSIILNTRGEYTLWGIIKIADIDGVEHIINGVYGVDGDYPTDIHVDGSIDFRGITLTNIRNINGEDGADNIIGNVANNAINGRGGDDTIDGWGGDDILDGGDGNDLLFGNAGSDILTGGAGADQFLFAEDGAIDRVTDFTDGEDLLVFSGATSLTVFDFNGDAALELNGTSYVILENVDYTQIDSSDLLFV